MRPKITIKVQEKKKTSCDEIRANLGFIQVHEMSEKACLIVY